MVATPKVQVICNSEIDAADVLISKHARETALKERWNEVPAEVADIVLEPLALSARAGCA